MKKLYRILNYYKLHKLRIVFLNKGHNDFEGLFDPNKFEITIYLKDNPDYMNTLYHELAHCVLYVKKKPYLNHTWQFHELVAKICKEMQKNN